MAVRELTLIEGDRIARARASLRAGAIRLSEQDLERALGIELKPEGICRGDTCVPLRDRASLVYPDGIDLSALTSALGLPLAADADEGVAVLGEPASARAAQLASLEAPDFTLPDLAAKQHSLSQQRGKKVLLIAYASW